MRLSLFALVFVFSLMLSMLISNQITRINQIQNNSIIPNLNQSSGTCYSDSDCVPASCCHPTSCVPRSQAPNCEGVFCTTECRPGTLDCGMGTCRCVEGSCVAEFENSA